MWVPPDDWGVVARGERRVRVVRKGAPLVGISRTLADACRRCERILEDNEIDYETIASFILNELIIPSSTSPTLSLAPLALAVPAQVTQQRAYDSLVAHQKQLGRIWG